MSSFPYNQQQLHQTNHHQHFYAATDVELVADFCVFLEHRVLTKNAALLRRMLSEFHAHRQEHTLAQFKCMGANLVAVLPFDYPDENKRRRAAQLLKKPKHALVDRTCAFEFLFTRVASKNLTTLKQIFAEFCIHDESALAAFVKRGIAAVTIVPYEPLPPPHSHVIDQRFAYHPYGPPLQKQYGSQPAYLSHYPPQQQHGYPPYHQHQSQQFCHQPLHVHAEPQEQQQDEYESNSQTQSKPANGNADTTVPGVTPKHERAKKIATSHRKSHPSQDLSARAPIARDGSSTSTNKSSATTTTTESNNVASSPAAVVAGKRVVKKPVRYESEQGEEALIAEVTKSSKRAKKEPPSLEPEPEPATAKAASPRVVKTRKPPIKKQKTRKTQPTAHFSDNEEENVESNHVDSDHNSEDSSADYSARKKPKTSDRTIDSMIEAVLLQFQEQPTEAETQTAAEKLKLKRENEALRDHKEKRRQKRAAKAQAQAQTQARELSEFPTLRWTRQDDATLRLKLEVRDRLRAFEALEPWVRVYHGGDGDGLPVPFDEKQAPRLAEKLRSFWKLHARTVWERSFWMPLAQDGDSKENVQRKARQQVAQQTFVTIINEAYRSFGAQLFVQLDEQRHAGWWYRKPIVDILAYHKVVGEQKCWEYVEKQLYERFPDCGLELPLKSPNYGVLRRHRSESDAMWSNTVKAQQILNEVVALKKKQQQHSVDGGGNSSSGDDNTTTTANSTSSSQSEASASGPTISTDRDEAKDNAEVLELTAVDGVDDGASEADGEGDGGREVALTVTADGDVQDDNDADEMEEDKVEELLIEKIALASSLEADPFEPAATSKTPSSEIATTTAADDTVAPLADPELGGADAAKVETVPVSGDAESSEAGASVESIVPGKELESARFAEWIHKLRMLTDDPSSSGSTSST